MTNEKINLWEEKNLTEVLKKYENNGASEGCDIIKNTLNESKKENLIDTTQKKWIKNCPICNKELTYKNERSFKHSIKLKKICRKCSVQNNLRSKIWSRKCVICGKIVLSTSKYTAIYFKNKPCKNCSHKGVKYKINKKQYKKSDLQRNCPTCNKKIFYKRIESKKRADKQKRICMSCVGDNAIKHRKPFTDVSKQKMRISHIKRLKLKNNISPNFNMKACEYFDELNNSNGWNLQHALNNTEFYIKELGYWVDAYDKNLNLVIEYDEPAHYDRYGNLKIKDFNRMKQIINHLQCKFFRYNEKTRELKEYKI